MLNEGLIQMLMDVCSMYVQCMFNACSNEGLSKAFVMDGRRHSADIQESSVSQWKSRT